MRSSKAALLAIAFGIALVGCGDDGGSTQSGSPSDSGNGGVKPFSPPTPEAPTEVELASHDQMLEELGKIHAGKADNLYFGDREIRSLRKQLETTTQPIARFTMLEKLGNLELKHGDVAEAIEHLEQAYAIFKLHEQRVPAQRALNFLFNMGLAYLRRAENENCVECRTADSCLLPISKEGIHEKQESSRRAIVLLKEALKHERGNAACVWLLNVACMTVGEYPDGVPADHRIPESAFAADAPFPRFRNVSPALGLDSLNLSGGAVVEDIDGDGRLDVMCSTWDISESPQLFLNNGDGTFRDVSKEWGLEGLYGGLNMVHADYDNDGDVDILILRGAWLEIFGKHPNSLLKNVGNRFVDVTFVAGLGEVHYPTQTAAWADYDLDGDLDLYVGNETWENQPYPSQLFRNNGDGSFTDVASEAGVTNDRYAKGTSWGDYDADGDPDLYVSNLRGQNRLYENQGNGKFVDRAVELDVAGPMKSFPTWFWDYDNDGNLDLFVASYAWQLGAAVMSYAMKRTVSDLANLYRGNGRGGFEEVGRKLGLRRLNITMGSNFGDLDNDGYPDFYLGTGYPGLEGLVPNVMYWNRGGKAFLDVSASGGFSHLQKGHAVAFADLDRDGDQDVFEQLGGAYPVDRFQNALFENPGFDNNWLIVELFGTTCNRRAVGARVAAEIDDGGTNRTVYTWVNTGGSFGSSPLRRHIGIGKATKVDRLTITWPGSREPQVIDDVDAGQFIRVTQGADGFEKVAYEPTPFKR